MTAGGIKLGKVGPPSGICEPGKSCFFTISISGATSIPYKEPFLVKEHPPAGWSFVSGGGQQGGWICPSPANCTYDVTKHSQWSKDGLTATSTWLIFDIEFKVPEDAKEGMVQNCVTVALPPAPGQSGDTIKACADVRIGQHPRLKVTKFFPDKACVPGGDCDFWINVQNEGKGAYEGPLSLTDSFPSNLKFESLVSKGLSCTTDSPPFRITCSGANLQPGETKTIEVKAKIAADAGLVKKLENCARLKADNSNASGEDIEGCDSVAIKKPGLSISKSAEVHPQHPSCVTGSKGVCKWTIKVSGRGSAPYTKEIKIEDELPPPFTRHAYSPSLYWKCSGTNKVVCRHPPANLTSQDSLELSILAIADTGEAMNTYGKPYCSYQQVKNCAKVIYDNPQQYQQEIEQACHKQMIMIGEDCSFGRPGYDASSSGPCTPPKCSFYDFTITGRDRYARGPLTQRITPPPGSAFPEARVTLAPAGCPASGWSCNKSGGPDGPFTCSIADCGLAPGEQVRLRIEGSVAPDLTEPPPAPIEKTACGVLEYRTATAGADIEQLGGKGTLQACATILVLARPPACAAGYLKTPDGLCCLASQMTAGGRCCPSGQKPDSRRRACVPAAIEGPPAPPVTAVRPLPLPTLRCRGGKVAVGGRCLCPEGTTETRGLCVRTSRAPIPPPTLRCSGGKVRVGNRCVCPEGTTETRGRCAPLRQRPPSPPSLPRCAGGKVPVGNRCVCPAGTAEMRGLCVRRPTPAQPPKIERMQIGPIQLPSQPQPQPQQPIIERMQIGPIQLPPQPKIE